MNTTPTLLPVEPARAASAGSDAVAGGQSMQGHAVVAQEKKKSSRILELDALRAIACLNLMLFHFTYVYQSKYGFASPLGFLFPYGKYGVQLFFMLSGFVNSYMLLRRRQPGDFAVGRMIRILPSYWLMIGLNIVLFCSIGMFHESVTADSALANLSVMPNLFGYHCWEPVTWTLQVEVLFYCFLALILITGLIDKPFKTLMIAVSFCCAGSLATGWVQAHMAGSTLVAPMEFIEGLFIMKIMPLFAMGMLLNEIHAQRGVLWQNILGIAFSAVAFHVIDERNHNPAATALLFGMLVASAYGKIPMLRIKPFLFISAISYSLYLFHNNLGSAIVAGLESTGWSPQLSVIFVAAFSIVFATAVTYWFERPVTKWLKARWDDFKRRRASGALLEKTEPHGNRRESAIGN